MPFVISVAQQHYIAGDTQGNARKILDAAASAHGAGARLLLTPELALAGVGAQDLYLRPAFLDACDAALAQLQQASRQWPGLALVVGHPLRTPAGLCSALSVLQDGVLVHVQTRRSVPPGGDDGRWFVPGREGGVFALDGLRVACLVGADLEQPDRPQRAAQEGARLLLCADFAPFVVDGVQAGEARLAALARASGAALVCARAVGGQDEAVHAGFSCAFDAGGALALRARGFEEQLALVRLDAQAAALAGQVQPLPGADEMLWRALVRALRDYVDANGFPGVLIGLSGGMDSALVLALAVDALGAARVATLMMASPYTAGISLADAREMARRVGVGYEEIPIAPLFGAFKDALAPLWRGRSEDTAEENLQARVRGTLLMAQSNKSGAVVLATGNKSELATGYCTLYGDMAGGFAPLKDVVKTRVYALARWRNAHDPFAGGANPIPERIITRAPSAELRADQTDQDSLPPYEVLDAIIERHVEQGQAARDICAAGLDAAVVARVLRLVRINEYKRRQAPLGPVLTGRGFGADWRPPVTQRFDNEESPPCK